MCERSAVCAGRPRDGRLEFRTVRGHGVEHALQRESPKSYPSSVRGAFVGRRCTQTMPARAAARRS
jgi:hypothetical protein